MTSPPEPNGARRTSRRVLVADFVAGAVVRSGGILVIVAVLGILAFLVATVVPLFRGAEVRERPVSGRLPVEGTLRVLAVDEYRVLGLAVGDAPEVVWFRLDTGEPTKRLAVDALAGTRVAVAHRTVRSDEVVLAGEDGRLAFLVAGFSSDFVLDERAAGLRAAMHPYDLRPLDDGVVRRVAGGNLLRVVPKAAVRGSLALPDSAGRPQAVGYATRGEDGVALVAATGGLFLARESVTTPLVGEPTREFLWADLEPAGPGRETPRDPIAAFVDEETRFGWVVGRGGGLLRLDLRATPAARREVRRANASGREPFALTAAGLVLGGRSLALCDSTGELTLWSPVPAPIPDGAVRADGLETRRLHAIALSPSPVVAIGAGSTRRTLWLGHEDGSATAVYTTNERVLARWRPFGGPVSALAPGSKDDGLVVAGPGLAYRGYEVDCPHPETNAKALFAPLHYEGYPAPALVYQSSAGTDEAEPKLSLTPLLFGTLKATFYAMLFALPLALLAALYTSQFMHPRVRAVVKPAVEVMASLPSVVLGFVAALVIAPFLEDVVPAVLATIVLIPLAAFATGALWHVFPVRTKQGIPSSGRLLLACVLVGLVAAASLLGNGAIQAWLFSGPKNPTGDFRVWLRGAEGTGGGLPLLRAATALLGLFAGLFFAPRLVAALRVRVPAGALGRLAKVALFALLPAAVGAFLAGPVESLVFGGDFRRFLVGDDGSIYDQRNSLVVGIAMGFAVIPIVFTISEDALSAIPESLKSAALACGASPWQTATRVVVPAAAPGIFSALMVGLGRAVGETMIVLMATGGTAILDPSIWNGFRSLSQNIATELPEAPEGGTLYRVLFLAGLLLFALTFLVNTAAEIVRIRFRRRFRLL